MATAWANPCGGRRWRYLDNGSIEVEGVGVPMRHPGSDSFEYVARTWDNWHCELSSAASRHGVSPAWLLALASVESGFWADDPLEQSTVRSGAGAIGVMQIMPATGRLFGREPEELLDPALNIDVGAELVADLDRRVDGGLPAISGYYNSGKLCCDDPGCPVGCENAYRVCTTGNYPGWAIAYNNTAIRYLDLSRGCFTLAHAIGFGAVAAIAVTAFLRRQLTG